MTTMREKAERLEENGSHVLAGLATAIADLQDHNAQLADAILKIDTALGQTANAMTLIQATLSAVVATRDRMHEDRVHAEKSIRRRIHATTSVKGVKKLEHTVEGTGYTLEEELAEWDAQDAAVDARQPSGSE